MPQTLQNRLAGAAGRRGSLGRCCISPEPGCDAGRGVIERGPLADPAVHAALSGLTAIKVDVSAPGAQSHTLMRDLAAAGPPPMIFLEALRNEASGSRLIGEMDRAGLLASISEVGW